MVNFKLQHGAVSLSAGFFFTLKKKLLALFVVGVMFINGFVPNAADISKHSAALLAGITAKNMMTALFAQSADSMAVMAEKLSASLINFLRQSCDSDKFTAKTSSQQQVPDIAGQTSQVEYRAVLKKFNVKTSAESAGSLALTARAFYFDTSPGVRGWRHGTGTGAPIFLAFLFFIIGFISRKGINNNTIINKIKIAISKAPGLNNRGFSNCEGVYHAK